MFIQVVCSKIILMKTESKNHTVFITNILICLVNLKYVKNENSIVFISVHIKRFATYIQPV